MPDYKVIFTNKIEMIVSAKAKNYAQKEAMKKYKTDPKKYDRLATKKVIIKRERTNQNGI